MRVQESGSDSQAWWQVPLPTGHILLQYCLPQRLEETTYLTRIEVLNGNTGPWSYCKPESDSVQRAATLERHLTCSDPAQSGRTLSYHTRGSGFEPQHHSRSRRNHSTRVSPIVSDPLDSGGLKVFSLPSLCCILRPWRLIGFFFIYI